MLNLALVSHSLSSSSLSAGAINHLASAVSRGLTEDLDLKYARLGEEKFKIFSAGLRNCKLNNLRSDRDKFFFVS